MEKRKRTKSSKIIHAHTKARSKIRKKAKKRGGTIRRKGENMTRYKEK